MNIFLVTSAATTSAQQLFKYDPIRANKQILECTQLLAFVDIRLTGTTSLRRKDGAVYRATKAQLNHPISIHMSRSALTYKLCLDVLHGLLAVKPTHACSTTIRSHTAVKIDTSAEDSLIVCRRGYPIIYVNTYADYSYIMLAYLTNHKWS